MGELARSSHFFLRHIKTKNQQPIHQRFTAKTLTQGNVGLWIDLVWQLTKTKYDKFYSGRVWAALCPFHSQVQKVHSPKLRWMHRNLSVRIEAKWCVFWLNLGVQRTRRRAMKTALEFVICAATANSKSSRPHGRRAYYCGLPLCIKFVTLPSAHPNYWDLVILQHHSDSCDETFISKRRLVMILT